jgi:CBS domain containing-hemolysin-like protein
MPEIPDHWLLAITVSLTVMVSFVCSLVESTMYSITRSQIETLRRQGHARGETLLYLRRHIDETIASILILNTTANVLGPAIAGGIVASHYQSVSMGLFSGALTFVVLFFGEIVPKTLGVRHAVRLAPLVALPLRLVGWVLWPLVQACVFLPRRLGRSGGPLHGTEEDIISLAGLVADQGQILAHEAQWVANALRLNDVTAYDLMTPNPVVARVPDVMRLRDTAIGADHWRFSRLPVCKNDDPDAIVGVLRRRKVFDALARDEFDRSMGELMDPPEFVHEDMPAHQLLDRFLEKRRHLFCVQDETGRFTGVVTLEDVMECLLGREIVDETDLHEDMQALARRRKDALLSRRTKANKQG